MILAILAILLPVLAFAALLQFFAGYCHLLISAHHTLELSEQARKATGIEDHIVSGDDFRRLMELNEICPDGEEPQGRLTSVRVYFAGLNLARDFLGRLAPRSVAWLDNERSICAYYAAVVLDRRMGYWQAQKARLNVSIT